MKKFKLILSCLFIISTSYSYADCPSMSDISIQDNHFYAPGPGGNWTSNQIDGHTLPVTKFMGILGVQKPTQPEGVVFIVRCSYKTQDNYLFELSAPYYQTYKINMTPHKNWTKRTLESGTIYACGGPGEDISDCSFNLF